MELAEYQPIVTIKTARRLLGVEAERLKDDEVIMLIEKLEDLAQAFIQEKVHNVDYK